MKPNQETIDLALGRLRQLCPPGTRVWTIARHFSPASDTRRISAYVVSDGVPVRLDHLIAQAGLFSLAKREGLTVQGGGMDMGFHVVSALSATLYPKGFGCVGERCRSNDHSNGDRDYTPHTLAQERQARLAGKRHEPHNAVDMPGHWHDHGDYALSHDWL
jgi:hypothetical protein